MPRLKLPPLPRGAVWKKLINRATTQSSGASIFRSSENRRRILLTSRRLTDDFVRALGVREGEVVVEAYSGLGRLTRSLLTGGWDETTRADWEAANAEAGGKEGSEGTGAGSKTPKSKSKSKSSPAGPLPYPSWEMDDTLQPPSSPPPGPPPVIPRLVVASDSSRGYLVRAFGVEQAALDALQAPFVDAPLASSGSDGEGTEIQSAEFAARLNEAYEPEVHVLQSKRQPGLLMAPASPYPWSSIPRILSHPLVTPHLGLNPRASIGGQPGSASSPSEVTTHVEGQVSVSEQALAVEATKRRWKDPEPRITVAAQIMDSVMGEQMVAQWVGSVVGTDEHRSWIWKWGRVRLALLVGRGLYDRLAAQPGEKIYCKLSVLANALFHISPLPPYHHVPNIDKRSSDTYLVAPPKRGSPGPGGVRQRVHPIPESEYLSSLVPTNPDLQPLPTPLVTTTWKEDFFLPTTGRARKIVASEMEVTQSAQPNEISQTDEDTQSDEASLPAYPSEAVDSVESTSTLPDPATQTEAAETFESIEPFSDPSLPAPLGRPLILGLLLVPRLDSPVLPEQKEAWDYILRKCFVTEASTLQAAMPSVAFGAENLLDDIESEVSSARGQPVPRGTVVRDLTVEQWARVVDVFDQWPFKPENLLLDSFLADETRELGQD